MPADGRFYSRSFRGRKVQTAAGKQAACGGARIFASKVRRVTTRRFAALVPRAARMRIVLDPVLEILGRSMSRRLAGSVTLRLVPFAGERAQLRRRKRCEWCVRVLTDVPRICFRIVHGGTIALGAD